MRKKSLEISLDLRWRELVFGSAPAREVMGRSRPTMRFRVSSDVDRHTRIAEGGNEYTAWLLLSHLTRVGLVTRFKFQPFNLVDYGGTNGFPDLLVELQDGALVIVEVKSSKYVTAEFLETYREHEVLLKSMGLPSVLWTDAKAHSAHPALSRNTRNTLSEMDRCKGVPLDHALLDQMRRSTAHNPISLAALLDETGAHWDQAMSALAANHLSTNIEEPIYETSNIYAPASADSYKHYFSQRTDSESWWRHLQNCIVDHDDGSA